MERVKLLRQEKRFTQIRLGIELDVSQETISGYETGKAVPPADMLIKLADVLNTTVDYLLGRTDERYVSVYKSDLSEVEIDIIHTFRKLSDIKKEKLLGFLLGIAE